MFLLTGTLKGHRIVMLGITGAQLGGIRNSAMISTYDGVRAARLPFDEQTDFVSILRADSLEELRRKAIEAQVVPDEEVECQPGLIMKPKGGLD